MKLNENHHLELNKNHLPDKNLFDNAFVVCTLSHYLFVYFSKDYTQNRLSWGRRGEGVD